MSHAAAPAPDAPSDPAPLRGGSPVSRLLEPGRDASGVLWMLLGATAALAGVAGVAAFFGSGNVGAWFAFDASPLTAVLVGAGFLGAAPMMVRAMFSPHWEQTRIAVLPAFVLIVTLCVVSWQHRDELAISGAVVSFVVTIGWNLGLPILAIALAVGIIAQLREPCLPMPVARPLPAWATPLLALQGSAFAGLGAGLLIEPGFWGGLLPWAEDSQLAVGVLAAWSLTLGCAVLQALTERDLTRLRAGLVGLLAIGVFACAGLAWRSDSLGDGWPTLLGVGLIASLPLTGVIGLLLARTPRGSGRSPAAAAPRR